MTNQIGLVCRPAPTDAGRRAAALAREAIGLFLEYRDRHGYDEDAALIAAVDEVCEGYSTPDVEA